MTRTKLPIYSVYLSDKETKKTKQCKKWRQRGQRGRKSKLNRLMYLYSVQLLDETSQSLQQFINLFIYDYLCIYLTVFLLVYRIFSQSFAVFLHYFFFNFRWRLFLTHSTHTITHTTSIYFIFIFAYQTYIHEVLYISFLCISKPNNRLPNIQKSPFVFISRHLKFSVCSWVIHTSRKFSLQRFVVSVHGSQQCQWNVVLVRESVEMKWLHCHEEVAQNVSQSGLSRWHVDQCQCVSTTMFMTKKEKKTTNYINEINIAMRNAAKKRWNPTTRWLCVVRNNTTNNKLEKKESAGCSNNRIEKISFKGLFDIPHVCRVRTTCLHYITHCPVSTVPSTRRAYIAHFSSEIYNACTIKRTRRVYQQVTAHAARRLLLLCCCCCCCLLLMLLFWVWYAF